MSLQPVFGEPNGYPMSDDQIVDQLIGNAYKIVKFVAERMYLLRIVADNIDGVNLVSANINQINTVALSINSVNAVASRLIEIQALHSQLAKLVALYPQIGMFGTIHANLSFLLTLPVLAAQVSADAANANQSAIDAQAAYQATLLISTGTLGYPVPALPQPISTLKFLRADGTWAEPLIPAPVVSGNMNNPMTAQQDLIVGGVAGAPTRLAKGTNNSALQIRNGVVVWDDLPTLSSLALGGPPAYPWAVTIDPPPPTSTLTVAIPEMVVQFPLKRFTLPPTNVTLLPNTIRDIWITDLGAYHYEDKALSDYWQFPRYDNWLHYARVQSSGTKVQGVYMRRATKPIPLRPSPRQYTDYHFTEYHAIPTTWQTWVDGMTAVINVVYRSARGDLWKCHTAGVAELAPDGPTFTEEANSGYDLVPSGSAIFTFRGRSAYAGALRVSARSGVTWYFSSLAAGMMAKRAPALVKDYLKSVAFHVVNEWITAAVYTEGRKVAGPLTQGRVWECVVGGTATATPAFTANAAVGTEVTEGTIVWRCIGNYAHPDQKFFWYDAEPTLRMAKSPDSHDSYAACWIWAVYRYVKATGDTAWLNEVTVQNGLTYQQLMRQVIDTNLTTQILANKLTKTFQQDGVPFGGSYAASFFMDNTEVWAGFAAAERLWTTYIPDAPYAASMAVLKNTVAEGLESLWEPETGTYKYVQGLVSMAPTVPGNALFYPLCMSQAWGFLWGVPLNKDRMYSALKFMNDNYPNWWARNDIDDLLALGAHYAYAVASGSNLGKAQIIDRVESERLIPGQADLYIMDAAYYLVLRDSLHLKDLMDQIE